MTRSTGDLLRWPQEQTGAGYPAFRVSLAREVESESSSTRPKALGPVRDLDVLRAYLTQEVASLGTLAEEGRSARAALMVALESDRYLAVLDAVEAAAEAPPVRRADLSLEKMAKKEFRKLRDQMRSLGDDPSSVDLHKARIRGKRARYAAELASIKGRETGPGFVKAAKSSRTRSENTKTPS